MLASVGQLRNRGKESCRKMYSAEKFVASSFTKWSPTGDVGGCVDTVTDVALPTKSCSVIADAVNHFQLMAIILVILTDDKMSCPERRGLGDQECSGEL